MINKNQVYDLYVAGYSIKEISKLKNCNERTIRRKIKEVQDENREKEINKLKLLGIEIEVINNKTKIKEKRVYNKNTIIKFYLDGYEAREIEVKYGYRRDVVYNIIRNLKRQVGKKKFEDIYEKIHIKNKEKLLLERKRKKYNRDTLKLTRLEVTNYISDDALFNFAKSAYHVNNNKLTLKKDYKKIATWDLPRSY